MVHAVDHYLAPRLLGRNVLDRATLSQSLSAAMAENTRRQGRLRYRDP
jgi:hypothetical protein